jgi:hypothetical protein
MKKSLVLFSIVMGLMPLVAIGCEKAPEELVKEFQTKSFIPLHYEVPAGWSSWNMYVIRHKSGACFVVLDPGGDGGGAITSADNKVCEYHERIEKDAQQ